MWTELGIATDGSGDLKHLAHAGAALGAFIADDEHVIGLDLSRLHSCEAVLFAVEDAGWAAMLDSDRRRRSS